MIKKILIGILAVVILAAVVQIVNASKYKMLVNVVEGDNVMGINPLADNLDFGDLSHNNGMTRYVSLSNGGGAPIYVQAFQIGEIVDLIKLDKNSFVLKSGEETKLAFGIHIPPSAQIKKYTGWVIIFKIPKIF